MKKTISIISISLMMIWLPAESIGKTHDLDKLSEIYDLEYLGDQNDSLQVPDEPAPLTDVPIFEEFMIDTPPAARENISPIYLGNALRSDNVKISSRMAIKSISLSLEGDGTESNPYLVGTAANWNVLADYMATNTDSLTGKYVKLAADIDFTSDTLRALGYDGVSVFNGTLNGAGYTIKGFAVNADAEDFGTIIMTTGESAYIYDLTVEGTVSTSYSYTGGVVGNLYGTLSNVTSFVAITSSAQYCAAGIVGYAGSTATITGCTYSGSMAASGSYTGGVVGYAYKNTITNCYNTDTITATGSYAGGIVGYAVNTAITGCSNKGEMIVAGDFSGGIVGYANVGSVTDCVNLGSITSSAERCVAGLAGVIEGSTVSNCSNEGSLLCSGSYNAGVVGYSKTGSIVTGCNNNGSVESAGYAAGVAGYAIDGTTVTNCTNSDTISTNTNNGAGGIVCFADYATINNCTNKGEINASAMYAGGICAYAYHTDLISCVNEGPVIAWSLSSGITSYTLYANLTDCVNKGDISVSSSATTSYGLYISGICSYTGTTTTFSGCTNYGTITGYYFTAGLVSFAYYTTMTGCYNYGDIVGNYESGYYTAGCIAFASTGVSCYNCGNEGSVTSIYSYLGGFAGCVCAGSYFENCYNKGAITVEGSYVGGFCAQSRLYITMINCYNEGTMTLSSDAKYVGGLIGHLYVRSDVREYSYELINCYNTADITAYFAVAGLLGYSDAFQVNPGVIMENCYNTGNITATYTSNSTSYHYPTGGLSCYYFLHSSYKNCWNSGNITSNGYAFVGGLFGRYALDIEPTASSVTISGCYNTGNVSSANEYVGGLIGGALQSVRLDSCYNTGDVTSGTFAAGGLIGNCYGVGTDTISNSWNSGTVTAGTYWAGGIVGYCPFDDIITSCFNVGNVTSASTDTTSGYAIGGICGYSGALISDCYDVGNVTGINNVGGLVGCPVANYSTIANSYFMGTVSASEGYYSGNIVGADLTDSDYWGDENSISATYYLSDNALSCVDSVSVGLSRAELASLDLGSAWTAGDNYTYPRLTTLADNDYAKAYAAAVIPADGDSYSSITTGFNVGMPDGVTWTASSGSVEIDGNNVTFSESFSGTLTMTATSGDVSVATELTCNVTVTGISDITDGGREVVEERFYNLAGAQVAEPAEGARAIYIVVKSYSDGTTETVKEVR